MNAKLIKNIKKELNNDNIDLYTEIEELIEQYSYLKHTKPIKEDMTRRFNQLLKSVNCYYEDEDEKQFLDDYLQEKNLTKEQYFKNSYGWGELVKKSSNESKEELSQLINNIKINYHKAENIDDFNCDTYVNYTIFTINDSHQFFFEHVEKESVELIYDEDTMFCQTVTDAGNSHSLSVCQDIIKSVLIDLNLKHTDIKTFIDFILFILNFDTNQEKLKYLFSIVSINV